MLGREVIPHPEILLHLIFRSLSNNLRGIFFNNEAKFHNLPHDFFNSKPSNFFRRGIDKLPEGWKRDVNNAGEYFIG